MKYKILIGLLAGLALGLAGCGGEQEEPQVEEPAPTMEPETEQPLGEPQEEPTTMEPEAEPQEESTQDMPPTEPMPTEPTEEPALEESGEQTQGTTQ